MDYLEILMNNITLSNPSSVLARIKEYFLHINVPFDKICYYKITINKTSTTPFRTLGLIFIEYSIINMYL